MFRIGAVGCGNISCAMRITGHAGMDVVVYWDKADKETWRGGDV
jgi:hypothetical protein